MRFLVILAFTLTASMDISLANEFEAVHACDEFAAHPNDPNRWAAGVEDDDIIPGPAVKFCQEAVDEHAQTPRFLFQLGRSLWAANRLEEGLQAFLNLEEEFEYAPVYAYLGDAYMYGIGGAEVDEELAVTLYQIAGESGFTPAIQVLASLIDDPSQSGNNVTIDETDVSPSDQSVSIARPSDDTQSENIVVDQARISDGSSDENAVQSVNFDGYNQPQLLQQLYHGDLEKLQSQGRLLTLYLNSFNQFFSQTVNFIDQNCSLLYEPRIEKALMQRHLNNVMGGGTVEEQSVNALGMLGELIIDLQRGPGVLIERQGEITVSQQEGEKDAARLAQTVGCESPITKRLYANLAAFVFNQPPIMSPEIARRKSDERFTADAGKSCVASFDKPEFCECMISSISKMDISAEDKDAIGKNFRAVASLGSNYPDLKNTLRSCRNGG